jgi:hypothetical protein
MSLHHILMYLPNCPYLFGIRSVDLRHPWEKVARTNENVSTYLGIAFVNGEYIMIGGNGGASGCRPRRQ